MNKQCSKCLIEKNLNCFNRQLSRKDGYQSWCKDCVSHNNKERYILKKNEPGYMIQQTQKSLSIKKKYPRVYKNSELLRKYGIDINQYDLMLHNQGKKCAICSCELSSPCVDHCHLTGKVRKLLCKSCNTLLGQAKDDIKILFSAIEYLKEFKNETNS